MIKVKLALFQMEEKGMLGYAGKLMEATFGEASAGLNTVDVGRTLHELVVAVVDAVVAVKTHGHQAIVAAPTTYIDHRLGLFFAPNDALQGLFRAIRDNLGVHLAAAFEQAEDDGVAARARPRLPRS